MEKMNATCFYLAKKKIVRGDPGYGYLSTEACQLPRFLSSALPHLGKRVCVKQPPLLSLQFSPVTEGRGDTKRDMPRPSRARPVLGMGRPLFRECGTLVCTHVHTHAHTAHAQAGVKMSITAQGTS